MIDAESGGRLGSNLTARSLIFTAPTDHTFAPACDEEREKIRLATSAFDIPDVKLIVPKRFGDDRGHFSETWSDRLFRAAVANVGFVQDNQSISAKKGTLRGLHFQKSPSAQGKLVRVLRGSVFDVVVDIRKGSPAYGRHLAVRLDALVGAQLWVPPGFLQGFCTLEDQTEVFDKATSYYSPSHAAGLLWSDQDLAINRPVDSASAILSENDRRLARLRDLPDLFVYEG